MLTLAISCLTTSNLLWFISSSYAILFFLALYFTLTTRHILHWVLFPLWLSLFLLSGAISPLFSCSMLSVAYWVELFLHSSPDSILTDYSITSWLWWFIFHIFAFSYCSWGFKTRMLKWFAMSLNNLISHATHYFAQRNIFVVFVKLQKLLYCLNSIKLYWSFLFKCEIRCIVHSLCHWFNFLNYKYN